MKSTERIIWRIKLICTGRDSHKSKRLAQVCWWDTGARQIGMHIMDWSFDGRMPANSPLVGRHLNDFVIAPDPNAAPGSGVSRNSYRFHCPSCGAPSAPPVRGDSEYAAIFGKPHGTVWEVNAARLWSKLEEARELGRSQVDVSGLD